MKYLEVTFTTHPCNETVNDVVSALAGEIGFESFVECEGGIQAYIQQTLFDEEALKEMVVNFPLPDTRIEYTIKEAEDKNWNEEWEKNFFQPIVIGDRCCIHSTFHKDTPKTVKHLIVTTSFWIIKAATFKKVFPRYFAICNGNYFCRRSSFFM